MTAWIVAVINGKEAKNLREAQVEMMESGRLIR